MPALSTPIFAKFASAPSPPSSRQPCNISTGRETFHRFQIVQRSKSAKRKFFPFSPTTTINVQTHISPTNFKFKEAFLPKTEVLTNFLVPSTFFFFITIRFKLTLPISHILHRFSPHFFGLRRQFKCPRTL